MFSYIKYGVTKIFRLWMGDNSIKKTLEVAKGLYQEEIRFPVIRNVVLDILDVPLFERQKMGISDVTIAKTAAAKISII